MRKVVTNTTPLLSLLKINQLDLLRLVYGHLLVPEAVWQELEAGRHKSFYVDLRTLDWLTIRPTSTPVSFPELDRGEAAAIQLAPDLKADLVLLDERMGRSVAHSISLPTTGTLGILLRAIEAGILSVIQPQVQALQGAGVWLHPALIRSVLELAGEG